MEYRGAARATSGANRSPTSANRAGIVVHREVVGRDVGDLVPAQRSRHRGARVGADRVGRGDRAVAGHLVVVDEDLLAALLLPPLHGDLGRACGARARGRTRWSPAGPRRTTSAARSARRRGCPGRRTSSGVPSMPSSCEQLAHVAGRRGRRRRSRCPAAGRGRCGSGRASRRRRRAPARGGTSACRGWRPTRRRPARSAPPRRPCGRSGTRCAPSSRSPGRPAARASGRTRRPSSPSGWPAWRPRTRPWASAPASSAGRAARPGCRRRPRRSTARRRAWSARARGSRACPGC